MSVGSEEATLEIRNLQVIADPMTVGVAPSTLKFNATLIGSSFQTGQALLLTVEYPGSFNNTPADASALYMQQKCISVSFQYITFGKPYTSNLILINNAFQGVAGIFITNCTLRNTTAYMNLTVNSLFLSSVYVNIRDFKNPNTTQPISFSLQLIDQNMDVIAQTFLNTTLSSWVPAQLISTSLTSSSSLAGDLADLTVKFTVQNQFYPNGKVVVKFPLWNNLLGSNYSHYIVGTSVTCTNVLNMNPALNCTYNNNTQELTVNNPVTVMTQMLPLSFKISTIRNPYSARPRGDFWIKTVSESGYTIDASENMTLTVSSYGNMKTGSFVRDGTSTTVSEPTRVIMNFTVDFPIAFPCRVIVQFPNDMKQYYPLGYVFTVFSQGIVEGTLSSSPFDQLLNQGGFTTIYMTATNCGFNPNALPQLNPVFFNSWNMSMSNKAWVKDSGNFAIAVQELFNGQYYQVALKDTGMYFPQESFTPGTIQSTSVTTVPDVGGLVKFKFTITPSHYIPSSSRLVIKLPPSVCLNPGVCTISQVSGSMSLSIDLCYVDGSTITINTPFGKTGFYQWGQASLSFVLNSLGTDPGSEVLNSQYIGVETYAVENGLGYKIDIKEAQSLPIEKLLASSYLLSTTSCTASSAKFCGSNGQFNPLFKFFQFEGSIALLQSGIFVFQDESRGQFMNPTPNGCAGYTQSQNAILAIMQVGNNRNDFDQNTFVDNTVPYINTASTTQRDPFIGGIFSFERCSYVYNMNFNSMTDQRTYNIKRYQISIEHDNTLKKKSTVVNIDKEWTLSSSFGTSFEDFPCKTLSDGLIYHPGIRGIMYLMDNRITLTVKVDLSTSATDDMCVTDFMSPSHILGQYQFNFFTEFSKINFQVSSLMPNPFVFLNNQLYVVAYGRNIQKYPTDSTLRQSMIAKVTIVPLSTTTYTVTVQNITEVWGYIDSIATLEMQGFVFTISNQTLGFNVMWLNPDLYDSIKSGPTVVETDSKWKIFQARQDNHMHRPIFGVKQTQKNIFYRITTQTLKVLEDTTFNTNFYDFGVQLNRFFGLTVLPGSCYCGTVDRFNTIKGIIVDLRGMKVDRCIDLPMLGCGDSRLSFRNGESCDDGNLVNGDGCSKDCQIEAWWACSQIEGERSFCTPKPCGNGLVDAGEECDDGNNVSGDGCTSCIEDKGYQCVAGRTPHCKLMCGDNLVYQQRKINAAGVQYLFYEEKCDTNTGGCLSTCEPDLGWKCTTNYATMISTCEQTCGNLKNDADMLEVCDDGNNVSGDGCAKGCMTIEQPYVCPLVGKCNLYCGNGIFEGDDTRIGQIGTQNEQCDDGNRLSGDGCSNTCTIEPGWTCISVFIGLSLEKPAYRSQCSRSGSGYGNNGATDYRSFYQMAQIEEFQWNGYTARGSNAGKFRIVEYLGTRAGTEVSLQGVTFVTRNNTYLYPGKEITVVKQWQGGVKTNFIEATRILDINTGVSVQKGTFGPFLVRTDNTSTLGFYSFLESSTSADVLFGKFYSTQQNYPAEFMGSHEIYYWPKFQIILARLGDGYTFKAYKFTPRVIGVAQDPSQFSSDDWIEGAFKRGIEVPGEIKVEPVFFDKYMAILTKQAKDSLPVLRIYQFLEQIQIFSPNVESIQLTAQSSQYLGYSLVYFGSDFGLLYKEYNNPLLWRLTVPLTASVVTIEANSFIPDKELGKLVFIQRRHDPMSEVEESRDVYGYFDNSAVYKFETVAATRQLRITQKIDLPTIGVFISDNRMIDVGKYSLAVYSAANCNAVVGQTIITKASAWFYRFDSGAWTCMDIPVVEYAQWQQLAWWTNPTPTA